MSVLNYLMSSQPDFSALEPLFADREKRTVPASLCNAAGETIAEGLMRLGTAADPGNIFYPHSERFQRDDTIVQTKSIKTGESVVEITSLRDCTRGLEPHFHFQVFGAQIPRENQF